MKVLCRLILFFLIVDYSWAEHHATHLFILSGQSNMQAHRPEEAFTPLVEKAFGKEKVIVIQDALGGQPIHRWWKEWKNPNGESPGQLGDLYDRLMGKVYPAIRGKEIASVCFLWMQGERDARMGWGELYEEALLGLHAQLAKDLRREKNELGLVIGRLSDFDMGNQKYPDWTVVREAQEKVAASNPKFFLINTDDLNDGLNRKDKLIRNDLHYSSEGYKIMGRRFAAACVKIIEE